MSAIDSTAALAMLTEYQGYGKVLNYLVKQRQIAVLDAFFALVNERRIALGFQPTTDYNVNSWAEYIFGYSLSVGNKEKNKHTDHELRRKVKHETKNNAYQAEMQILVDGLEKCINEYYQ